MDNFQGEDNKIILLSLVRSNATNNIGYLAFKNRICVALSRAKHGLYIVGNMSCLSKASKIWREIDSILKKQEAIGKDIILKCSTHNTFLSVGYRFGHHFTFNFSPLMSLLQVSQSTDFDALKHGDERGSCFLSTGEEF